MYKRISVEQTQQMIANQSVIVADIRDPAAYSAGHIPASINVTNQNAYEFVQQADLDLPLIVVCYHGHSSQPAAQYFYAQGFEEVYSMDGGFEVWKLTQEIEK